jgi:flagellin
MTVINTNTSSMIARDAINRNDRAMSQAMERLSTGSRINSAKDDAAGLAIADRMSAQVSGLNMAVRNANDAISMLQTIEGATKEITNMLGRMRELAVQSASGTYTDTDRTALDLEFGALMDEISRIAKNTEWNGQAVLKGNIGTALESDYTSNDAAETHKIQLGASSGQTMDLTINTWVPTVASDDSAGDTIGDPDPLVSNASASAYGNGSTGGVLYGDSAGDAATAVAADRLVISSVEGATIAITNLDKAIDGAAAERAKYGSYMARLQHASDNLANISMNTSASLSSIADADYAVETTELARTQIISQASTAMLAQANQVKQTVLALLQ